MRNGMLIILVLLFFSCKKADLNGVSNLNNDQIYAIGHGGMGIASSYPLNSYESLTEAITQGAQGVEIDVQMTKDCVLVAYHDEMLDDNTSCSGRINELNWNEIKACEYVNGISGLYSIMRLDDFMLAWLYNQRNPLLVFDCKLYSEGDFESFSIAFANKLAELDTGYYTQSEIFIEAQNTVFLEKLQLIHPSLKLFIYPEDFESGLATAKSLGLWGITIASSKISEEQIGEAHAHGLRVAVWNVNSRKDNVEAINKSPDYIQTDKLKGLLKLLK